MYPTFSIFGITIYTFGLFLVLCFFMFIWMLRKLCKKFDINDTFFFNRILIFFLTVLIFSRLFYILGHYKDYVGVDGISSYFIMNDYNFSIIGAIIGYIFILYTYIFIHRLKSNSYIDVSILSFLFASFVGFLGAFFGGQLVGKATNFGIEIQESNISFEPIFPLGIVFAIIFFILFCLLYIIAVFIKSRGIVGYIGLVFIGINIYFLDFFSAKYDYYFPSISLSFNQYGGIFLILIGIIGLMKVSKKPKKKRIRIIR